MSPRLKSGEEVIHNVRGLVGILDTPKPLGDRVLWYVEWEDGTKTLESESNLRRSYGK